MVLDRGSKEAFLIDSSKNSDVDSYEIEESVDLTTLDDYCDVNGVERINYLKIDTEGHDLEVLKGSVNMISERRIDLIEVEAGMNPSNLLHVPFETLKDYLESCSYVVFGIYEQAWETRTGEAHLRRINAVFVSLEVIKMNKQSG